MSGGTTPGPTTAGVHNYLLGGKDNYGCDRVIGDMTLAAVPQMGSAVQAGRRFLTQAVECAAYRGVGQFLDLGCGFPFEPYVHQTARGLVPEARVAYVDRDERVLSHARAVMGDGGSDPLVKVIDADVTRPWSIYQYLKDSEFFDFGRPVAVLMCSVLHFVPEAHHIADMWKERMADGSCLAVTHATGDSLSAERAGVLRGIRQVAGGASLYLRSVREISALLKGLSLVSPPGLIEVRQLAGFPLSPEPLRPSDRPLVYGGLAFKEDDA